MMQIIFGLKKITEKKLFCQVNHGYLPLQYFGDGYYKIGENDKKQSYLS
jgi:hypothetical protein